MANSVRILISAKDEVSSTIDKIQTKASTLSKTDIGKGMLQGVGIAGATAAFGLLDNAISGVVDVMADSVRKAQEEQAGIAKLDASLKSNIKGYDGNRDAIEGVIASREKLAFSDGEQRDALATLVTRTHDVNKALDLERQAMDLARLKGISLADASTIIGKVYSGNVAILQRYGIAVSKGATSTQALAEIQKAAAGQAQAYADTTQGSFESLQIAVDDLQEQVGTTLLPVLKDLATYARDDLIPALSDTVTWIENNKEAFDILGKIIDFTVKGPIGGAMDQFSQQQKDAQDAAIAASTIGADAWATGSERIAMYAGDTGKAIIGVGTDSEESAKVVEDSFMNVENDARAMRDELSKIGNQAADDLYDPIIAKAELAANKREQADQRAIISGKNSTKEQVRDARARLTELQKDAFEHEVALIGYGKLNKKEQAAFLADLQKKWAHATGQAKSDIAALIAYINRIPTSRTITITAREHFVGGTNDSGHAAGGPMAPYSSSLVGENGPEILTLGSSGGSINPSAAGWGGGGGMTLNLSVSAPLVTPGGAEALAQQIVPLVTKALQRQQLIPRR